MNYAYFNIILDMVKLITTPNLSQYVKEKSIKELVCRSVDIQPDFGVTTKQTLKTLINVARSEKEMLETVMTYMSTHDCNE